MDSTTQVSGLEETRVGIDDDRDNESQQEYEEQEAVPHDQPPEQKRTIYLNKEAPPKAKKKYISNRISFKLI